MSTERNLRLLWCSDSPTAETGFGRVTREVVGRIHRTESVDVAVLGWNYNGDPHSYGHPIFPTDQINGARLVDIIKGYEPDAVVVCSDPWVINEHTGRLQAAIEALEREKGETARETLRKLSVPVIGYTLLDGKNLHPKFARDLHRCASVGFACEFGRAEVAAAGYRGPSWVAPYGVDPSIFHPVDREESRRTTGLLKRIGSEDFVFGAVNRNAPRKRFDLTIEYFAEWWRRAGEPTDAWLYIHASARDDYGWDLLQLARYHGVLRQLVVPLRTTEDGKLDTWTANQRLSVESMKYVYASITVGISTTVGEGFGLPALEGMACGTPQMAPDWSALGEWARGAALLVPCTVHLVHDGGTNVIGGIPDREEFVRAMDLLYRDEEARDSLRKAGIARAAAYRWPECVATILTEVGRATGTQVEVAA